MSCVELIMLVAAAAVAIGALGTALLLDALIPVPSTAPGRADGDDMGRLVERW